MATKPSKPMDPDALERQLQRDLEVIRKYREVQSRYGGEPSASAIAEKKTPAKRDETSLIAVVETALSNTWQRATAILRSVQTVRPQTARGPLRNALMRLVESGVAEKRGTKATGVEFKRKAA